MDDDDMNTEMPTVSRLIASRQIELGFSDAQLAAASGLTENALRMSKEGKMKLPVSAVKGMAKVFQMPAQEVLRIFLNDYMPELHELMEDLRMPLELTKNEQELLKKYRRVAKGRDAHPVLVTGVAIVVPKST